MKIEFVRGMSDAKRWFRHSGLCVRNRMGQNVGSASPASPDRRSPDQLAFRQAVKEAGQAWGVLEEEDRRTWNAYARHHGHLLSDQLYKDLSGWEVFLPAFLGRSLLGAAPPSRPAPLPPPEAVAAIEELPATEDDTFSFRVTHGLAPEGHVLIVRITPATATRARRPYARTARMICGHGPDSVTALPSSGGVVTFRRARFSVAPGQRFGVAMRIMRLEDGVTSPEFFADLLRAEPPDALAVLPEEPAPEKNVSAAPANTPGPRAAKVPNQVPQIHQLHEVHSIHCVPTRQPKPGARPRRTRPVNRPARFPRTAAHLASSQGRAVSQKQGLLPESHPGRSAFRL